MLNQIYLGIDLDDENAVVSYYQSGMKEPETLGMVAGSEVFQIPVLITKKKGVGQWFIGEEARKIADGQQTKEINQILSRALRHEKVYVDDEVYPAEELLTLYLKKLLLLGQGLGKGNKIAKIAITLPGLSREAAEVFSESIQKLGMKKEQLMLLDRRESFYYFAYSQPESLCLHDVCLFDYRGEDMNCCRLERNRRTQPQVITLTEEVRRLVETDQDEAFLHVLEDSFRGHIISSVYLVGDGFSGEWMKRSVTYMCQGRRAFMGKNLYSKGACYAAEIRESDGSWPYVYMGENEMKVNVCLKVYNHGKLDFYTLISAGDNWYETEGECEVLLDGTPEISFWLQPPHSREARIEKLELSDLPDRPVRATRLRINAKPLSDRRVRIRIRDLGFGEFFKSSNKVFEYNMEL
jgi:hypothetical protein